MEPMSTDNTFKKLCYEEKQRKFQQLEIKQVVEGKFCFMYFSEKDELFKTKKKESHWKRIWTYQIEKRVVGGLGFMRKQEEAMIKNKARWKDSSQVQGRLSAEQEAGKHEDGDLMEGS